MPTTQTRTADYQAIVELLLNYGATIDSGDYGTLRSLFTEDAELILPAFGMVIGSAAIAKLIRKATADRVWQQHFIAVAQVNFSAPGQADAVSNLISHSAIIAAPNQIIQIGGCYFDRLVKRGGEWQIASKRLETRWTETREIAQA